MRGPIPGTYVDFSAFQPLARKNTTRPPGAFVLTRVTRTCTYGKHDSGYQVSQEGPLLESAGQLDSQRGTFILVCYCLLRDAVAKRKQERRSYVVLLFVFKQNVKLLESVQQGASQQEEERGKREDVHLA